MATGTVFLRIAEDAIGRKRGALGSLVGNPSSDVLPVVGSVDSFVRHFDNGLDIYFTVGDPDAHETHGDIKRKYDILSPASTVADWSSDLVESANRVVTYKLSGFRSNPIVADTTFVFDIGLRFRLQMEEGFGSPGVGSLLVEMLPGSLQVQAFNIGAETVKTRLQDGIAAAFQSPLVLNNQVEVSDGNGPIVLDLIVTSQGGLQFLINPLPTVVGRLRQLIAQRFIDEQALPALM